MKDGRLVVLDICAGTGSATAAFRDAGALVIGVELEPEKMGTPQPCIKADIRTLDTHEAWAAALAPFDVQPEDVDVVWASPPCQGFSVASMGKMWDNSTGTLLPKHETSKLGIRLLEAVLAAIHVLQPTYWWMENPRAAMRKMPQVQHLDRVTVTYCQYGETRMKPTDLWGVWPDSWKPRPPCKNGMPCHEAAPRGSPTGTQGIKGAKDRGRIPHALSLDICKAVETEIL